MKFLKLYEIETDTLMQCPISDDSARYAFGYAGAVATDEPEPGIPVYSRLRSERHLVWTTPEEWKGAL